MSGHRLSPASSLSALRGGWAGGAAGSDGGRDAVPTLTDASREFRDARAHGSPPTPSPARRGEGEGTLRRGWCPGLARPMSTGDGLLVRLHPGNGVLTAAQLRAVATGARAAGNGLMDVTARGNLQIRGVRPGLHPWLAAMLAEVQLGDTRPPGGPYPEGPQRLTLAAPLAGLDPTARWDAFALAAALEAAAVALAGLHPKLLVVVEDGGRAGLAAVEADLRLAPDAAGRPILVLAGDPTGLILSDEPVPAIHRLLARLAALGPRRVRDLAPNERAGVLAACVGDDRASSPPPCGEGSGVETGAGANGAPAPTTRFVRSRRTQVPTPISASSPQGGGGALGPGPVATWGSLPPGLHDLGPGGVALVLELAFGRGDAALLGAVADWAEGFGDGTVRLTPGRGLVLPRLREPERVRGAARRRGLIVAPDDPRRAVAACPGAPACASGHAPVQADAAGLAAVLAPGVRLHVSGCAKGCAHPGPAALTLVALAGGGYGVVPGGTARDSAVARLSLDVVRARLAAGGAEAFPVPPESA